MTDRPDRDEREIAQDRLALFWLLAGPLIWTLHFLIAYPLGAALCAKAADDAIPTLRLVVGGLSLVAVIVLGWLLRLAWRRWDYAANAELEHADPSGQHRRSLLGHAAFLLTALSIIGVGFMTLPPFLIDSCR